MKILSIRIKNLASLAGEHLIDFDAEPLASAGLIAIVGKTGAGKSTILDAMCLALFNKIPRLKESDGKLLDSDGSELLTNSPLTVLRRGSGHGFAELCFIAQDQKRYLARWEVKRARESATGKLQNVQRYLKCLSDDVVIADKTKAVDSAIQQITQLSFEQFTRAVLLAQSEVTAFLKARDNERGELLEYLTNSSIFGKIGQLAYEKTKTIAAQRKELENVLGHLELLSEEELAELRRQFTVAQQTVQHLEQEKRQHTQQQQWFEQLHKFEHEIALKQQQHLAQQQAHAALAPDRQRLTQLETFSGIRPVVFQQQQILHTLQQLTPKIQQQQQYFTALSSQFNQEKNHFQQADTALTQFQTFEVEHQQELAEVRKYVQERDYIADEYKKTKGRLQELDAQQQPLLKQQQQLEQQLQQLDAQQQAYAAQLHNSHHFAPLDKSLNAHLQQLHQFIQHYQKVENTLGNLQQAQQQRDQDTVRLQELMAQFGTTAQIETQQAQCQKNKEQQLLRLNQLDLVQQKLQQWFDLNREIIGLNGKLHTIQQQQHQAEQQAQQAELKFQSAQSEREKLQTFLQQQRLLHADNIEHLRAELKSGEACLVCGSTEHPYREDENLVSKALYELQQQQEQQAMQQEQQCLQLWQTAQQQFIQLSTEQTQLQQSLQQANVKTELQRKELQQHVSQSELCLDLNQTQPQILATLQAQIVETTQHKQQDELNLEQLNQAHKDQLHLTQKVQHISHQLESVQQWQQHIQQIMDCLSAHENAMWQEQPLTAAQKTLQHLQQRAQQLEQVDALSKQQEHSAQQLQVLKTHLSNLQSQLHALLQQLQEVEAKGKHNTEAAHQLIVQMNGATELKATEWLQQHDQQRQQLQQHYQQLKQSFEQARQNFEQQKNALEQLQAQQQQQQQALDQVQTDISIWLTQHSDFTEPQLTELLVISSTQEQQLRLSVQQADRLLNEAAYALTTLQNQWQQHLQQQPQITYAQLLQLISANVEQLQQQTEQRDQLKLKLELHQQNLAKQQQFATQIQQIQLQEHRWAKISDLMGDKTGKKFRDLAQQYHLDILIEYANQQLALLSQRYTLKRLDNSLSLAIIDHDMDGETRSVASLSGGESFLTSLALSLAIANMAAGSMKIESLFIDEGFGTLDASSLHMVMNAFDQLQNQGRKVVLISHIQEMHERIPVQIQVQPMGSGASRIQIVS
ncbi:AAA family ATPase [Acinetobacter sp. GXMZU3951]